MAYTKTTWQDRQVTSPLTYTVGSAITANTPFTLVPAEGTVVQSGTPINATNMNNIENGIANALEANGGVIGPNGLGVKDSLGNLQPFLTVKTGDANGMNIAIGSGGGTIVGSGESATTVLADSSVPSNTEHMYVVSDQNVKIWSNIQNGVANKHELNLDNNGKLTLDGYTIGNPKGANVLWTGAQYMHGTQTITPSVGINDCPNGWALVWSDYTSPNPGDFDWAITFLHKNMNFNQYSLHTIGCNITGTTKDYVLKSMKFDATTITGNDVNDDSGTNNDDVVLRMVLMW